MSTQYDLNKIEKELRKAKTHKGRKFLLKKQGLTVEEPKQTLFIRGNKTSEVVNVLLKELYLLKKDHSVMYGKRHDIHPLEDVTLIEKFCEKQQASLFVFANSQKKRPDNFVIGRLFENKVLDMCELGIENFKSIEEIKSKINVPAHSRPVIIFQGDIFEYNPNYIKLKNLLYDLFSENEPVKSINVVQGLTYAVVISANDQDDNTLYFRTYSINLNQKIAQNLTNNENYENIAEDVIQEIGPHFDMKLRRQKWATEEAFKQACKQPKVVKKKENKNVSRNSIGDKVGKVFVDRQDYNQMALKKRRKLNDKKEKVIGDLTVIDKEAKEYDI